MLDVRKSAWAYLVGQAFFEALRGLFLNLSGHLGVTGGVGNTLTVFVLHVDELINGREVDSSVSEWCDC